MTRSSRIASKILLPSRMRASSSVACRRPGVRWRRPLRRVTICSVIVAPSADDASSSRTGCTYAKIDDLPAVALESIHLRRRRPRYSTAIALQDSHLRDASRVRGPVSPVESREVDGVRRSAGRTPWPPSARSPPPRPAASARSGSDSRTAIRRPTAGRRAGERARERRPTYRRLRAAAPSRPRHDARVERASSTPKTTDQDVSNLPSHAGDVPDPAKDLWTDAQPGISEA